MERLQVSNNMLDVIRKFGYKPYDIVNEDGYFVFDYEKDSVTRFKIKGLLGWRFGMWIGVSEDENSYIQIFAQHKDNIDKFKPTRSAMLVEYSKDDYENIINSVGYYGHKLEEILGMIKRHPLISYRYDAFGYMDYFDKSFTLSYLQNKIELTYKKVKDYTLDSLIYNYTKFKIQLCKSDNVLDDIKLVDRNTDGWISSPRFSVDIVFKNESKDEEEIKFLDKWFKKDEYHNMRVEYRKPNGRCYCYDME